MKQIFQDVADGRSNVLSVPRPACKRGHVVIKTSKSLISAGTERMLVEFSRAGYLEKARQQPEKVEMVLDKVNTDGFLSTIQAVRSKLNEPVPMGYSNVGRVVEVGSGVSEFSVGDRVLSNGYHAEFVCIGKNLCAKVPDKVSGDEAVFGVVGAIALQGVRLAQPTMGECFVVIGLGLIGLLTVQILRASGCRVLGADFDEAKLEIARTYGADTVNPDAGEEFLQAAHAFSRSRGVDGVIIAASAESNEPIHQSATICRKRARIILIGVVGLDLRRADFYEKELTFQVSCSYGPGRYDPHYEEDGNDYPVGFVRWTEQRNFEAVLDMLSSGQIRIDELKRATFDIDNAGDAYDLLISDRSALGVLIDYPGPDSHKESRTQRLKEPPIKTKRKSVAGVVAAIGAGNYAGRILLPAFGGANVRLKTIVSSQGVSGSHVGKKLGFEISSTDAAEVFEDKEIDTVIVATRHDSHARFTLEALAAGKNVFVEKPLALTLDELHAIDSAYHSAWDRGDNPLLMVGFNRRYAPLMQELQAAMAKSPEPVSLVYTCNAGRIDADSWVQDVDRGGGRVVGEACHFIDTARFLADSPIVKLQVAAMTHRNAVVDCKDTVSITLEFESGSMASILYLANGHKSFPKERIEVFHSGRIHVLDNFRKLKVYGGRGTTKRSWKQDKGQIECCRRFCNAIHDGADAPIAYEELMEVSKASIDAARMLACEPSNQ